jgi:hypothetical protein
MFELGRAFLLGLERAGIEFWAGKVGGWSLARVGEGFEGFAGFFLFIIRLISFRISGQMGQVAEAFLGFPLVQKLKERILATVVRFCALFNHVLRSGCSFSLKTTIEAKVSERQQVPSSQASSKPNLSQAKISGGGSRS